MVTVSDIYTTPPKNFKTPLEQKVYEALEKLAISYERIDTGEAVTMEDCIAIDEKLSVKTVKTLFLCNRQQTSFYLFITPGDKPFRSKDFGAALGVSRVSFAPSEKMDGIVGTCVGSTTVFSVLLESARDVRIVVDKEVLSSEWYGCTDGTTTCYMKLRTDDVFRKLLPSVGREYSVIEV